ncbi:Oligo-1,6-glucosidase 1 [Hartmannibacter diazotrophicus]|uniref:Oligo-1,6-glucosidase 1 n=1 Tax=Hartmannibacter diazotrophicus TaxID=1482074 RepID=A0A2C9CZN1_9HYPH|nr:alpha-glucosidase [Hartmannibacter diazotrophicus]SON53552.1 Oligo-1,6-glucosidase 1 [Hartmannibacter diazotrophicus]
MTSKRLSPKPTQIAAQDPDWWRGAVIYQVYPRSFQDSNDDGIGDLKGITSRLAYLADLGVDAVWLSPIFTSPMKDFGYDISDYCDVDPIFGTIADFDDLVAEAHRLGLKVMIDQVISHTADVHPWFAESRASRDNDKADWYVWADANPDGTPPNNWLSVFGGSAWEWDTRRCQYYLHNFLTSQPDLNYHSSEVQAAILDTVRFWLERGVDGFRMDTVNYYFHDQRLRDNPPNTTGGFGADAPEVNPYGHQDHIHDKNQPENLKFLKRFRSLLNEYPGAAAVGEVGDGKRSIELMAAYTSGGDKLHMCYTFDLLGDGYGREFLTSTIGRFEAGSKGSWPCWAFSNHDVPRAISRFASRSADPKRLAKVLCALLLSLRGSVCLYQGEELGLTEAELAFEDLVDPYGIRFWPEFKGRDGCRTPMVWTEGAVNGGFSGARPWLPVPAEHLPLAVDRQTGQPGSILEHFRSFLAFRRQTPVLVKGDVEFIEAEHETVAFVRRHEGKEMLCLFNLADVPVTFVLPKGMKVSPIGDLGFDGRQVGDEVALERIDAFLAWIEPPAA